MGITLRIALVSLLLCFVAVEAFGQKPRIDRIEVADYGLYETDTIESTDAPDVPGGSVEVVTNVRNLGLTRTIPAQRGVKFGFRYRIIGEPHGTEIPLVFRTLYPQPGLTDPASGKVYYRSEDVRRVPIGVPRYDAYGFREAWELVPGVWTFEIWYEGRKLVEQSFTVVPPLQGARGD